MHLSHLPDGKDYPDAQNLGLLDQLMALKWVHENKIQDIKVLETVFKGKTVFRRR